MKQSNGHFFEANHLKPDWRVFSSLSSLTLPTSLLKKATRSSSPSTIFLLLSPFLTFALSRPHSRWVEIGSMEFARVKLSLMVVFVLAMAAIVPAINAQSPAPAPASDGSGFLFLIIVYVSVFATL